MANFGGKPSKSRLDHVNSYKMVVFSSLLSGVVIWVYYRGSFTSKLAIKSVKYPFHDLNSFSKSNYK